MAMEVSCGQCHGRLLVETPGVIVACPHCGIHLSIPAPAEPQPVPPEPQPAPVPEPVPPAPTIQFSAAPETLPQPPATESVPSQIGESTTPPAPMIVETPPQVAEQSVESAILADQAGNDSSSLATQESDLSVGWNSTPKLCLSDGSIPTYNPEMAVDQAPATLTEPVAELESPAPQPSSVVPSPTSDRSAPTSGWVFTPAASTSVPEVIKFSDPALITDAPNPPASTELQPLNDTSPSVPSDPASNPHSTVQESTTPGSWVFAPAVPVQETELVKFSAPGLINESAPNPEATEPAAITPVEPQANGFIFTAAPQPTAESTSTPPPVSVVSETTGTAPAATSGPVIFGATTTTPTPAPTPSPLVFGAAPISAPTGTANEDWKQASSAGVPESSVAQNVADYAESEHLQRQKLLVMMLILVGSYASALTLFVVWLFVFGTRNNLESLPDLVPQKKPRSNEVGWYYNPPKNDLPYGHVLRLGQSCRYGNLKVTPVRITRGPLRFEHFTHDASYTRDPSSPVLKLWVKFENVSRDQTFAPIDPFLLFTRDDDFVGQDVRANSFIAIESERKTGKRGKAAAFHFELSRESEYLIVGQNLGKELEPGKSVETFIPSDSDAIGLKGRMVWRFQLRKGFNRKSLRGVTTLVDVRFSDTDVTEDQQG